jgi:hypothetical protein
MPGRSQEEPHPARCVPMYPVQRFMAIYYAGGEGRRLKAITIKLP